MWEVKTENVSFQLPESASEMTFGQRLDIKKALSDYTKALKSDNPELDGMVALRAAILAVVDAETLDKAELTFDDYWSLVEALAIAIVKRTDKLEPKTDLDHEIKQAIDRLNDYKPSFRATVEALSLESNMPNEPFTSSEALSAFYGLSLKQAAICIWPEIVAGVEPQTAIDKAIAEKGGDLLNVSSDTMLHLRDAMVNFLRAYRKKAPRSSSQSKGRTSSRLKPKRKRIMRKVVKA